MAVRQRQKSWKIWLRLALLLVLVLVWLGRRYDLFESFISPTPAESPELQSPFPEATTSVGDQTLAQAFNNRTSGITVEFEGRIERLLSDDNQGSRHQRVIIRLDSGQTVLVAHNIDLAPRVRVESGERVKIRGVYEWNELGGVVHWTHHDPDGRQPGGWFEHKGQRYR